jgi:hypothetical protein
MVCNALLPALTCSSQFAAHVRASHMDSSSAERRATLVMTAASEASDPVWCFASIAYCRVCSFGFQANFVKVLTKSCVSCVFVVMARVHAGEYRSRQANTPRQAESKKNVQCARILLARVYRPRTGTNRTRGEFAVPRIKRKG